MPSQAKLSAEQATGSDPLFIPSFCDIRMVVTVIVIAQLLAFVLVLAPVAQSGELWNELGLVSLFIQWVALCSAGVLCMARPWLRKLSNGVAASLSYALLLAVTAALSEVAHWLVNSQSYSVFVPLTPANHAEFLMHNVAISAVVSAVGLRYLYVQHQWRHQIEAEARARFEALQARIRPHFLFNSLNTIAALTRSQPEQAEEAVQDLSDLFRASLGGGRDRVRLEEELEIAKRYTHIESLRLGDRLQVSWEVDDLPLRMLVPPLILQPLLENAVYHGIEPQPGGGEIKVRGSTDKAHVIVEICNPRATSQDVSRHEGNRMAVDNIRQRLALAYGPDAGMDVEESDQEYCVRVRFPIEKAI